MKQTTNLKLNKPERTDPADITQLNENWDIIDEEITTHEQRQDNPHNVTKEQLGIDLTNFEEHIANKDNPHEVTAAQVNAVSKDGDTVNGDLTVKGAFTVEDNPIKVTNGVTTTEIQGGTNGSNENGHHFLDINLFGKVGYGRLRLNIEDAGKLLSAKELLYLVTQDDTNGNEQHWYKVYHEGSKPSGSYSGTNTTKTIKTGGIGNSIIIWSDNYTALVTSKGGFTMSHSNTAYDGAYDSGEIKFVNGDLIFGKVFPSTENHQRDGINGSGITYYYQVL